MRLSRPDHDDDLVIVKSFLARGRGLGARERGAVRAARRRARADVLRSGARAARPRPRPTSATGRTWRTRCSATTRRRPSGRCSAGPTALARPAPRVARAPRDVPRSARRAGRRTADRRGAGVGIELARHRPRGGRAVRRARGRDLRPRRSTSCATSRTGSAATARPRSLPPTRARTTTSASATATCCSTSRAPQWRHVAWDLAYLRVPWPTCWCSWRLPDCRRRCSRSRRTGPKPAPGLADVAGRRHRRGRGRLGFRVGAPVPRQRAWATTTRSTRTGRRPPAAR